MRVIVTGATSFIGQAAVKELLRRGCQVTAVVRPDSPGMKAISRKPGVEVAALNLAEIRRLPRILGKSLREETGGAGTLSWLHLGWEGAGSANRSNPALQRKNIDYALDALETAADMGCGRFLFSGSQAEYGICSGLMREDMECRPVSEYGKNKVEVCVRAGARAKERNLDYLHARIFSVYGPGDHPWSLISTCIDTYLQGGHMEMGTCTQLWNFPYVEEAARVLAKLLLGKTPGGVYNVAGEDTRPLKAYMEELYRLCGSRGSFVFGSRRPNAEGQVSLEPDLSKIKKALGFCQEISFAEGIRRTLALRGQK